eukprot:scaffold1461_cov253-Pinguiococcus_pyrenoidosus.AAC.10
MYRSISSMYGLRAAIFRLAVAISEASAALPKERGPSPTSENGMPFGRGFLASMARFSLRVYPVAARTEAGWSGASRVAAAKAAPMSLMADLSGRNPGRLSQPADAGPKQERPEQDARAARHPAAGRIQASLARFSAAVCSFPALFLSSCLAPWLLRRRVTTLRATQAAGGSPRKERANADRDERGVSRSKIANAAARPLAPVPSRSASQMVALLRHQRGPLKSTLSTVSEAVDSSVGAAQATSDENKRRGKRLLCFGFDSQCVEKTRAREWKQGRASVWGTTRRTEDACASGDGAYVLDGGNDMEVVGCSGR